MSTPSMSHSQQSWSLTEGAAMRLPAAADTRWLRVTQGRVWLTHSALNGDDVPLDCWLEAGDSVELPAGQDAVLESWPSARFELLLAMPAEPVSASLAMAPSAALRRWLQSLRPAMTPANAPCAS